MSDREDFYDILAVDRDASRETIERAYRERVRELHPDVSPRDDARERFKRVTHAKEVLTDRRKRAHYDRMGHDVFLERERRGRTDRSDGPDPADPGTRTVAAGAAGGTAAASAGGATTAAAFGSRGIDSGSLPHATSGGSARATRGASVTGRSSTRRVGGFAVREAVASGLLATACAGSVALALVPPPSHYAVGVLVASWLIVSAIAGVLAGALAPRLPSGLLRTQALPAALLAAAPVVAATTMDPLVALALAVYGGYAAVFRTAALVAARWRSPAPAAAVWFVATLPAGAVVFATRGDARGLPGRLVAWAVTAIPSVGSGAAFAISVAVAVAAVHAVLRLGRRASLARGF